MSVQNIPEMSSDLQSKYLNETLGQSDTGSIEKWFREVTNQNQPFELFGDYINTPNQPIKQQPYFEPFKKYGPPPQRTAKELEYQNDLNGLVNKHFKKSPLEDMFELMFSTSEKEQFLIDMGYILEFDHSDGAYDIYKKSSTGEKIRESKSLNEIFMKEMGIKFKILLLSKAALKLKL